MKDLKLNAQHDLAIIDGDLAFVEKVDADAQEQSVLLKTMKGEWFLDQTAGLDYVGKIWGNSSQLIRDAEIKSKLMALPGSKKLLEYVTTFDQAAGHLFVNYKILTDSGIVDSPVEVAIAPVVAPPVTPPADVAPTFTIQPSLSGEDKEGATKTCNPGTAAGTTPITTAYQWLRDGVDIAGETSNTYTQVYGDVGTVIGCRVTLTNVVTSISATATAVAAVKQSPELWVTSFWDASDLTTLANGDAVPELTDRNGVHDWTAPASNEATFDNTQGANKWFVDFDQLDDNYESASLAAEIDGVKSLSIGLCTTGVTQGSSLFRYAFGFGAASGSYFGGIYNRFAQHAGYYKIGTVMNEFIQLDASIDAVVFSMENVINAGSVVQSVFDNTSSTVGVVSAAGTALAVQMSMCTLGCRYFNGSKGFYSEMNFYFGWYHNAALTPSIRAMMNRYASDKGLTLSTTA